MADAFTWKGNSRAMFDGILAKNPFFIRPIVRRSILQELSKETQEGKNNNGNNENDNSDAAAGAESTIITEEVIYKVVQKITPENRLKDAMEILDGLKTNNNTN